MSGPHLIPKILLLVSFLLQPSSSFLVSPRRGKTRCHNVAFAENQQTTIQLTAETSDEKVRALFAWVTRAFAGDSRYGNLFTAIAAVYGNLQPESPLMELLDSALEQIPEEEEVVGAPFSQRERESASLGAMGAAQWTGQWRTRPHALLSLQNITSLQDWKSTLPRGCKRTLKKTDDAALNFTVTAYPIRSNKPAPHSSLAHFRCVVEHELRLLAYSPEDFFDALTEAVSRYMGTTRMTGEIREYRCNHSNKIIAFAHEVRKGNTIRGQWFYGNDDSSKRYVWFHSVQSLVERAILDDGVDVVDLGPSGSDAFSDLKARYGFVSVDDWPMVADYTGPFWNYDKENEPTKPRASLYDVLTKFVSRNETVD